MVTFKICTFVYLNVDYHHQEHFFWWDWNDSRFQHTRRGVKVLKFWNVCSPKTLISGRSNNQWVLKRRECSGFARVHQVTSASLGYQLVVCNKNSTLKTPKKFVQNPRKHLLRLASDSQKKNPGFIGTSPVPLPLTLSELWEWLFPLPSHNSWRERTPLCEEKARLLSKCNVWHTAWLSRAPEQSCEGTLGLYGTIPLKTIWSRLPYVMVARWDFYGTIG